MPGSYLEEARSWIGRKQHVSDVLAAGPARALCALLDRDDAWIKTGAALPPLWHWLYLQRPAPLARLGPDGHERLGEFLPPLPFPRRMWAGGKVRFLEPLTIGAAATHTAMVTDVQEKQGRGGTFALVTVRHRIEVDAWKALEEDQQLTYLPDRARKPASGTPDPAETDETALPDPDWTRSFQPTPAALFRFSALTLNGHRIHWDTTYARDAEGYPDLVVHAPLLALLLLDGAVAGARGRFPSAFEYRARAPLFAGDTIRLEGRGGDVRALAPDGRIAMSGTVLWG